MIGGLIASKAIDLFFGSAKNKASSIATDTGVEQGLVDKILNAAHSYATKDERAQKQLADEMDKARQHDISTFDKGDTFSNRLRSAVRPVCTFICVGWYVYARVTDIPLQAEDYALIGGVLAFWFGFRPFEKGKK